MSSWTDISDTLKGMSPEKVVNDIDSAFNRLPDWYSFVLWNEMSVIHMLDVIRHCPDEHVANRARFLIVAQFVASRTLFPKSFRRWCEEQMGLWFPEGRP